MCSEGVEMNLLDLSSGVEVISYEECRELLGSERVGRLGAMAHGAGQTGVSSADRGAGLHPDSHRQYRQ